MREELSEWNAGKGIDLGSWTSCSGAFRLAVGYAEYFWPEFELVGEYITRAGKTPEEVQQWEAGSKGNRRAAEATMNHMHLVDINYHDLENLSVDLVIRLGAVLREIYEAKLRWQFPDRPCTVVFYVPEDPEALDAYEITFWQKSHESERSPE
ncbi:MAG: hypothetical protein JWL59_4467 [Chthoniobacteraceae bacterium]|nr:hypothetical protein [Chthoniobacteraceae bacterium]